MNAVVPLVVYQVLKSYHYSDLVALSAAGLLPAIGTCFGIIRQRHVDLIGALALLGTGVSIVAVLIGGDPRILLIRESFLTGALGARVLLVAAISQAAHVLLWEVLCHRQQPGKERTV